MLGRLQASRGRALRWLLGLFQVVLGSGAPMMSKLVNWMPARMTRYKVSTGFLCGLLIASSASGLHTSAPDSQRALR